VSSRQFTDDGSRSVRTVVEDEKDFFDDQRPPAGSDLGFRQGEYLVDECVESTFALVNRHDDGNSVRLHRLGCAIGLHRRGVYTSPGVGFSAWGRTCRRNVKL